MPALLSGPRPFLLGKARIPLLYAAQYFTFAIPNGPDWVLKFLLADYKRTVAGAAQTTPDLSYELYDAKGNAFHVRPVLLPMVTSPAGAKGLNATNLINVRYAGGSSVKLRVSGQAIGTGPGTVSITLFGIRGTESMGA